MKRYFSYIVSIIFVILLLGLLGFTYGYYQGVFGNDKNSLSVSSKFLSVEYTDGTSVMNFKGDYLFPGNSAEKTFTVTNTGEEEISYNIIIDNVVNKFERIQDLRYQLYIDENANDNVENFELVTEGAINNNNIQYLYSNKKLSVNSSDLVKFVFHYSTTAEIQNMDMNKTISFKFNIDVSKYKVSNFTEELMLSKETINSYRIYGNSIQDGIPTPDTPVQVESLGDKTVNLIDFSSIIDGDRLIDNGDDTFSLVYSSKSRFTKSTDLFIPANTTFTVSAEMLDYTGSHQFVFNIRYKLADGTHQYSNFRSSTKKVTHTFTSDVIEFDFYQQSSNAVGTYTRFKNLMINLGSTAVDYEPYGYKIPIKVNTKNIFSVDDNSEFDKQEDGSYLSNKDITTTSVPLATNLKGVYTISAEIKSPVGKNYRPYIKYTDGTTYSPYKASTGDYISFEFTTNGKDIEKIGWDYTSLSDQVQFRNYQIEKGTEATEYEEGFAPELTKIFLDEPLRKIGDYADYIDFDKQQIVRKIKSEFISTVNSKASVEGTYGLFLSTISEKPLLIYEDNNVDYSRGLAMSNKFSTTLNVFNQMSNYPSIINPYKDSNNSSVAYTFNDNSIQDVEAAQNALGEGFYVDYVMENENIIPTKLPSLNVNSNITNFISVDTLINPSNVEIESWKEVN